MKGHVLANFLSEAPIGTHTEEFFRLPVESPNVDEVERWTLFTDGASNSKGSGAGFVLISPSGVEFTYALWLNFTSTNSEAGYETGMARKMKANYVIREIHMGSYGMHIRARSIVAKAIRQGYYWPTMHKDARNVTPKYDSYQVRKGDGMIGRRATQHTLGYRTSLKQSNGETPFNLTYESEAVIPAKIEMPTHRTMMIREDGNEDEIRLNMDLLQERRESAVIREAKYKTKMEQYYNQKVRPMSFKPDEYVF
nr:reverse transcriptase domain-containing protein [Tanacetum cinerariifolium]